MHIQDLSMEESKLITNDDKRNLAAYEVEPPAGFETGKAKRLYPKGCYQKAFEYVAAKEDAVLVHGLYQPSGLSNHCGHAWAELPGGIVFDGVLQRFYPKDVYSDYYQIKEVDKYTSLQMYEIGFKSGGHYGPW